MVGRMDGTRLPTMAQVGSSGAAGRGSEGRRTLLLGPNRSRILCPLPHVKIYSKGYSLPHLNIYSKLPERKQGNRSVLQSFPPS